MKYDKVQQWGGDLKGRVALVLGAVKGIGKGIATALAGEGVQLALTYFDWEDHLPDLEKDIKKVCGSYLIIRCDLRSPAQVQEMVDQVISRFGRLDFLINNIERGGWPVVHGPYTESQWDLEMATTLKAKWWVFNAVLPYLKDGDGGAVINISSIAGIVGRSGPASLVFNDGYAAACRAVSSFTETWARTGAPSVRVNELMLGFFETRHASSTRGWALLAEDEKRAIVDHTLLKRIGRIEDVVKAVLFLLKDAPFLTGAVLRLDGGYVLGGEPVYPMPPGVLSEEEL